MKKAILLTAISGLISGLLSWAFWPQLAVMTAPAPTAVASNTQLAADANRYFWKTLHAGDYEAIEDTLVPLQAAALQNPNDPVLLSHMAWLHIWRISESTRLAQVKPGIVNQLALSRHYFDQALQRVPDEPRYAGFLSGIEMSVGHIAQDQALSRQGYFRGLQSIKDWPEFNGFSIGYALTGNLPADHERFAEGLEMIWANTEVCTRKTLPRDDLDLTDFYALKTQTMPERWRRACTNTWIAPYNEEGFLLVLGDALVKSGDWQTGIRVYQAVQASPTFASWPYRHHLSARITNAQANVESFRQPVRDRNGKTFAGAKMMFRDGYSCMGCHQHSEQSRQQYQPPAFITKTLQFKQGQ